jgi:outer membrane protein TolC
MQRTPRSALAVLALCALAGSAPPAARGLTLPEGLAVVERASREAAVSAAEEEVQVSAEAIASKARLPSVDAYVRETMLAYQPGAIFGTTSVPIGDTESFAYGIRVRQLLYDFGKTTSAVRAAGYDLEAKRIDTALARNRSALRFVLTYSRLLRAERLLALQREEVTRYTAHRDDTKALLEAGTITEDDLLQAEVRLADAVQKRLQAENGRALAAAQVNSQLLRPLDEAVAAEEIVAPPAAAPGLAEALAAAERDRVELRQVAARISSAEARREGVRTEYYPQLFLAGGYDYAQNQFQVHEGNWSVLAGVEINLFSGGVTQERMRQKDRELQVLVRLRELLLDAVRMDVREATLALGTARSRVDATGKAVEQAKENHRLQQLRYTEGVGTATDVLDAVSLLGTAEQNELNARHDVTDALARLDFAVGRDLTAAWGGGTSTRGPGGRP